MTDPKGHPTNDAPRFDLPSKTDDVNRLAEHLDALVLQDAPTALSSNLQALVLQLDNIEPGSINNGELQQVADCWTALHRILDHYRYEYLQPVDVDHHVWPPEVPGVHGTPFEDEVYWHLQGDNCHGESGTCAVVAQEMIIYKFTGTDPGEDACLEVALENDWFNGGTSWEDVGKIVENYGIDIHKSTDNTLEDLAEEIDQGHGVVAVVESYVLWYGSPSFGIYDHAICVTGYERADDGSIAGVWVNDSGSSDGQGHYYDAPTFRDAFENCGGMMVATDEPAPGLSAGSSGA